MCVFSCNQRGKRRGSGALDQIMRVRPIRADRIRDCIVRHGDDARRAGTDDRERIRVRLTHRHAIGVRLGTVERHHTAFLERARVGRRAGRLNADDLGPQSEKIAHQDRAADAGAETDRHVQRIERRRGAEQFQGIRCDTFHQIGRKGWRELQPFGDRESRRLFARHLEVVAILDQTRPECAHRGVLLHAVAVRHDNRHRNAIVASCPGQRLSVIAACGRDDAAHVRPFAAQAFRVEQPAAQLEGAGRRVVLVFHPDFGATALREQRPRVLRRARKALVNQRQRGFQLRQRKHIGSPKSETGRHRSEYPGHGPLRQLCAVGVRRA